MPAALKLSGVSKRFGRSLAVDAVDLEIEVGRSTALLGPNGAGKTTLLRLAATLLRPSAGSIRILGIDAGRSGVEVRRLIGVLAHECLLYPDLSASENLLFYARLFRVPDPAARIREPVERMDLGGWAHRPVRTLSRGLLQRCALARVLLHRPRVLLLDEPFTGLDIEARTRLCAVLAETHRAGATLLMSTHDLATALEICDSAVVLARGRVVWQGSVGAAERGDFEARYRELVHRDPVRGGRAPGAATVLGARC